MPPSITAMPSSEVAIGRWMKGEETLMATAATASERGCGVARSIAVGRWRAARAIAAAPRRCSRRRRLVPAAAVAPGSAARRRCRLAAPLLGSASAVA